MKQPYQVPSIEVQRMAQQISALEDQEIFKALDESRITVGSRIM